VNFINDKKAKIHKSRIIFVMSVNFLITSILAKIHNTSILLKENKDNQRRKILNNTNQLVFPKKIKKHAENINYILKISDTLGEALNYIKQNYKNGTKLQTETVLEDSIEGVNSINIALETMYSDLDNKSIKLETNNLGALLDKLKNALDESNMEMAENIINSIVSNEYTHWKRDIENEFR